MQRQRTRDTSPELALRSAVHARGLRYRVDARPISTLRRKADLVFSAARVAVFVDGCFWHNCPDHGRIPTANADWWTSKLARTHARDIQTTAELERAGWTVVRVWEHEDVEQASKRVIAAVRNGGRTG